MYQTSEWMTAMNVLRAQLAADSVNLYILISLRCLYFLANYCFM